MSASSERHAGPAAATRNSSPGVSESRVGAHEAAEEEQVDAADADALAARGERVPELVQHDRAEEQERGDHRGDEALAGVDDRVVERVVRPAR